MRFLVLFLVCSLSFLSLGFFGALQAFSPRADISGEEEIDAGLSTGPASASRDGLALVNQAEEMIASETSAAMLLLKQKGSRKIFIEKTDFQRAQQVVKAEAVFYDGGGPRPITMFVDAYVDNSDPVASYPFEFQSTGSRQPVIARFRDEPVFKRFALRFEHQGAPLDPASPESDAPRVHAVSPDAMLFHSDYPELRNLLEQAGYLDSKSFEPAAMFGAVRRFRIAMGIDGPSFITLRDLFALRVFLGLPTGPTKLEAYVEWSSGIEGGWVENRALYEEHDNESNLPAEQSTRRGEIYEDMEPAAENDPEFTS
jgi:hypothetical protein